MLTLIKEDGTGKPDANSYADRTDGDAYHDGHLYASAWTAASNENKERALVFATLLIDATVHFNGAKSTTAQSLHWPRTGAPDPDRNTTITTILQTPSPQACFQPNEIPKDLIHATCEMARELLAQDRTAAPDGEGLAQLSITGFATMIFRPDDRRPILSHLTQRMLSKLGSLISPNTGSARLIRT